MARAFDKADSAQRRVLEDSFGNPQVDSAGIAAVQQVLRSSGALDAVETVISELTAAALAALARAPVQDAEAAEALHALSDHATRRRG
jgi:geranylgeranyl diphosphate synthase, type I